MAVCGAPIRSTNHANLAANLALDMLFSLPNVRREYEFLTGNSDLDLNIR